MTEVNGPIQLVRLVPNQEEAETISRLWILHHTTGGITQNDLDDMLPATFHHLVTMKYQLPWPFHLQKWEELKRENERRKSEEDPDGFNGDDDKFEEECDEQLVLRLSTLRQGRDGGRIKSSWANEWPDTRSIGQARVFAAVERLEKKGKLEVTKYGGGKSWRLVEGQ